MYSRSNLYQYKLIDRYLTHIIWCFHLDYNHCYTYWFLLLLHLVTLDFLKLSQLLRNWSVDIVLNFREFNLA